MLLVFQVLLRTHPPLPCWQQVSSKKNQYLVNRLDIQLSTTGSSVNQPPPPKHRRQRGLASFVANNDVVCDITNLEPIDKRASMDKAEKKMTRQHSKHSARGDATAAAKARWDPKPAITSNDSDADVDEPVDTLKRILKHDKTTFDIGFDDINTYVEQNISHETLKSMVIKVFSTAINSWDMSILQAAQYASDVTGICLYCQEVGTCH